MLAPVAPPKVLSFTYSQDTAAPLGTLNSLELPGSSTLRVDLVTQFALGGTVEIFNAATNASLVTAPISSSAVSVQVPATALADGAHPLFAKLTRDASSNTQTGNPQAVKTITLDRTAPGCALTSPTKDFVGPFDDADPAAGYQLRVSGTASAKAATIELKVSGLTSSGKQPRTDAGVVFDFVLPDTGTALYVVSTEAIDASGNVCTATRQITADFDKPALMLTSPTAAGSPYGSFNLPLTATVIGGDHGKVQFSTTPVAGQARDLGQASVPDGGLAATTGAFVAGMQTVSAVATDAVGNRSLPVTQLIDVAGAGSSIIFTAPAANPARLTSGAYAFVVATSAAAGTPVTFVKDGVVPGAAVNTQADGSASLTVPLSAGTYVFRAEIGTPANFVEVAVTVDLP